MDAKTDTDAAVAAIEAAFHQRLQLLYTTLCDAYVTGPANAAVM